MRGRPPPPPDVLRIEAVWTISGVASVTTSWYLFAPGSWSATDLQLNTLLGDFFLGPIADLLAVVGTDVECTVLRLTTYGSAPQQIQFSPSANAGAIGTTNPLNGSLVLTWRNNRRGAASLGHTNLPLSDELVDADHKHLKSISWSQAQQAARFFVSSCNSITSPDGGLCVLIVLHTSSAGAPLPNALMSPVSHGDASPWVGTLQRRTRMRDPSPSPF